MLKKWRKKRKDQKDLELEVQMVEDYDGSEKDQAQSEDSEDIERKKSTKRKKNFLKDVDQWVKKTFFLSKEERAEKAEQRKKEAEEDKEAIHVPTQEIIIVLVTAIVLSLVIILAFDFTGWRSAARNKIVDAFVGRETLVIKQQYEETYAMKLEEEKEAILKEEKEQLAKEREAFKQEKDALEIKRAQYQEALKQLQLEKESLEDEKKSFEEEKIDTFDEEARIKQKTEMISEMEPDRAADILASMDDIDLVANIIKNLKKDEAAAILEVMETEKAADIINRMK